MSNTLLQRLIAALRLLHSTQFNSFLLAPLLAFAAPVAPEALWSETFRHQNRRLSLQGEGRCLAHILQNANVAGDSWLIRAPDYRTRSTFRACMQDNFPRWQAIGSHLCVTGLKVCLDMLREYKNAVTSAKGVQTICTRLLAVGRISAITLYSRVGMNMPTHVWSWYL